MKLVLKETGKEINIGDTLVSFRGDSYTLVSKNPPHKPSSQGKVYVEDGKGMRRELYPSVFEAEYVQG